VKMRGVQHVAVECGEMGTVPAMREALGRRKDAFVVATNQRRNRMRTFAEVHQRRR